MAIEPLRAAKSVFEDSLNSLMAHTIRGVVEQFWETEKIQLRVAVIPDKCSRINLVSPQKGATSMLMTNFVPASDDTAARLLAKIYIHKDANKHLARVCIAHEMFHLLMELDAYNSNGKKAWPDAVRPKKLTEDQCNQFAWELCRFHDEFNRRDDLRKKYIFFPDHTFDKPFNMNDTAWYLEWPRDITLDPMHPFHQREPLPPKP